MFYNTNRFNNMADIDVEPNMNYAHENGALVAMIEGYENERALFEAAIMTDVQEATMLSEGASAEEIVSLQEGAITSFFAKIKEFFKKLWEKIKAVFHGFIARFDAFFKSGDKLVKKYRAELVQKSLKGVDFKFDEPKDWNITIDDPNVSGAVLVAVTDAEINNIRKANEDFDREKEICNFFNEFAHTNSNDPADFDEDFHDKYFKGEDDVDGESIKMDILNFLEKKNAVKNAQKLGNAMNKAIANIIKHIDKEQSDFNKTVGKKGKASISTAVGAETHGGSADKAERITGMDDLDTNETGTGDPDTSIPQLGGQVLSLLRKRAGACQVAITKFTSVSLKELKDLTSRCKSTLARMVAAKEEATLLDAIEDAVYYETDMMLRDGAVD